jgi:hypothetical protein
LGKQLVKLFHLECLVGKLSEKSAKLVGFEGFCRFCMFAIVWCRKNLVGKGSFISDLKTIGHGNCKAQWFYPIID